MRRSDDVDLAFYSAVRMQFPHREVRVSVHDDLLAGALVATVTVSHSAHSGRDHLTRVRVPISEELLHAREYDYAIEEVARAAREALTRELANYYLGKLL